MRAGEEKRASPRNAFERPIQFDLNYVDAQGLITIEQEGAGVDISENGLGLFTAYPLKKDAVLRLHFPLDAVETTLPVFAKVAWAKLVERRFRVGLEFLA
jgi:hypothetical protein